MGHLRPTSLLTLALLLLGCASYLGYDPALMAWRRQAQDLRGLRFERAVEFRRVARQEIPEIVLELVETIQTPEYRRAYEAAYVALGVLPDGSDLPRAIAEFQESGVMGLYDPVGETMYVVTDVNQPEERNATVVHELIHALQHQRFPEFFRMRLGLQYNDDVVSALSAVLEGDAEFSMFGSLSYLRRTVSSAEKMRDLRLYDLKHPSAAEARSPLWVRASHYFPYAYGSPVAARFYETAGNEGLNDLLREPPFATLQLIAPELPGDVTFVRLPLAALEAALDGRCRVGHHNVAGALTIQVLFQDHLKAQAEPALETFLHSWAGDRFTHLSCGDEWELAWMTRWKTREAASEFAAAIEEIAGPLGEHSRLSGRPRAQVRRNDVLVLSEGLEEQRALLLESSEFRRYNSLASWIEDGCFGEGGCPESVGPISSGGSRGTSPPPRSSGPGAVPSGPSLPAGR